MINKSILLEISNPYLTVQERFDEDVRGKNLGGNKTDKVVSQVFQNSPVISLLCGALCMLSAPLTAETPTHKYLTQVSEEQIAQDIQQDKENAFPFDTYTDFFRSVIAQENEHFIGYHATTTAHYIFQEFVRAAWEERNGSEIPEDFYFLRAPGGSEFDNEGCSEIVKRFGRPDFNPDELRKVVMALINAPINSLSSTSLEWQEITDEKIERLYSLLLSFAMFMPNKEISRESARKELQTSLEEMVSVALDSNKKAKLLKAIKKFCKHPFADDFRDLYPDWLPSQAILFPFDDSDEELQNLLIAINISLYGNHGIPSESTVHIFAKNESVEIDDQEEFFLKKTRKFLKSQKLNVEAISKVYSWAKEHFPKNGGVLLQIFSDPEDGITDLNSCMFVSGFYGDPFFTTSVKTAVQDNEGQWLEMPDSGKKVLISKQLRLVLSNKIALNPWSGLKIKQHDFIDPKIKEELRERVRLAIH